MNDTSMLLRIPRELKEAVELAAGKANVSTQTFIRETLAQAIGYDMKKHPRVAHNRKFNSPEERAEYWKQEKRRQRALEATLLGLPPTAYGNDSSTQY